MSGCHAATVTRYDSKTDFGACPCCSYSAAGEPFDTCPCRGYSAAAGEPFRRLPLHRVQRESSRLLYMQTPKRPLPTSLEKLEATCGHISEPRSASSARRSLNTSLKFEEEALLIMIEWNMRLHLKREFSQKTHLVSTSH